MIASEVGAYPSEAFQLRVGALKYETRLERLANDKHSRLIYKLINYGHKKYYNLLTILIKTILNHLNQKINKLRQ
jgi:hypothetical protein